MITLSFSKSILEKLKDNLPMQTTQSSLTRQKQPRFSNASKCAIGTGLLKR